MKQYILILTGVVAAFSVSAQDNKGDLNRQMEVVRNYEPTVEEALKIDIAPNMVDTMALRPDIDYSITASPINYGFDVTPINAAKVSLDLSDRRSPLYIKAGLGYPFQTLLDVYANTVRGDRGFIGGYLNHYGSWSKIENDNLVKAPASQTFNSVGVLGQHNFGRFKIDGELSFDYDKVSRYGYYSGGLQLPEGFDTTASALRQNFSDIQGKVVFSNTDLDNYTLRIGLAGGHFADRFDYGESNFSASLGLGKLFSGRHEVMLDVRYDGYYGSGNLSNYGDNIFSISPKYTLRGGKLLLSAGLNFTVDALKGNTEQQDNSTKTHIFPLVDVRWDVAKGNFIPYLKIDGGVINNGYRNTVAANPYVKDGLVMPNTAAYNARLGFEGHIASSFSYNVFGGYSIVDQMQMFANLYSLNRYGNTFIGLSDHAKVFTLGADFEGRISGAFSLRGEIQYYSYKMDNLSDPIGMPDLKAGLEIKYSHRDKFAVTAGIDYIGKRYFCDYSIDQIFTSDLNLIEQEGEIDLKLGAEVKISKTFDVFVNANNLLNQRLYNFNHYPTLGTNVMAGVKIKF